MRREALYVTVLVAALPLASATAASPTPTPPARPVAGAPRNFTILPGAQLQKPLAQGQKVQRAFTYTLAPGQASNDTVAIINPSKTAPLTVRLSVSDGLTAPRGGGLAFNDTRQQRRLGRWLHLSSTTVTVAPYHVTWVPLSLSVPAGLPAGEYEGAINATNVQSDTITSGHMKFGVFMNRRCLVLVHVAGAVSPGLRVSQLGVTQAHTQTVLQVGIRNTGTVIDYPQATLLTFAGPSKTYQMRAALGLIMAGDSTTLPLAIASLIPPGMYQLRIQISYIARTAPNGLPQRLQSVWSGPVRVPARAVGG